MSSSVKSDDSRARHGALCTVNSSNRSEFNSIIIPVFVDDITIASKSKDSIQRVKDELRAHFKLRDLGPTSWLLGVKIERDRAKRSLSISQRQHCSHCSSRLRIDNLSALSVAKNPEHHGRMKHLDLRFYWLRDEVAKGRIAIEHLRTSDMPADILTKSLAKPKLAPYVTHTVHRAPCRALESSDFTELDIVNISRIGEYYPDDKFEYIEISRLFVHPNQRVHYSAITTLHAQGQRAAPYALSSIPLEDVRWTFDYPDHRATMTKDSKPVLIRLPRVIHDIKLAQDQPFIEVHPVFRNDDIVAEQSFSNPTIFDPDYDGEWEHPPAVVTVMHYVPNGAMIEYIYTSGAAVTPQSSLAKTTLPLTYSAIASSCTMSDYEDNYDLWELCERHPSEYGNNSSPRSHPASPIDDNNDTIVEASPPPSYSPPPRVIPPPLPTHLCLTNVQRLWQNLNQLLVRLNQATRNFETLIWGESQCRPFSPSNTNFLIDFTVLVEELEASVQAATEEETLLVLDFHVHKIVAPTRTVLHRNYLRPLHSMNRYWGDYFARYPNNIKRTFDHHRLTIAYHLRPPISVYEYMFEVPHNALIENTQLNICERRPSWFNASFLPPNEPFRFQYPLTARITYQHLNVHTTPLYQFARLDILEGGRVVASFSHNGIVNVHAYETLPPLRSILVSASISSAMPTGSPPLLCVSDSPVDRRARETPRHHLAYQSRFSDTDFDFLLSTYDTKLVSEVVSTTASEDSTTRLPVKDTSTSSSETQTGPHLTSITTRGATKSEGVNKVLAQTDTSLKKALETSHFASEMIADSSPCHSLSRLLPLDLQSKVTLKRKNLREDSVRSVGINKLAIRIY
ncbi:hypothetical protein NUW54_g8546 [Trametes sanguinea]|uniref:Uncharacterized protein n=1 Tax=Trametes sanguinea TaxID=158606 RepID=A0ACC1PD58_9APHY|nr:hypothetical protein NUW54_g8546 [Trametes sanguinea]